MMRAFWENLAPALIAGILGGMGGYVALKVDIAVLKTNQELMSLSLVELKRHGELSYRNEDRLDLLEFRFENRNLLGSLGLNDPE